MLDPHEIRMQAGQASIASMDALTDETVAMMENMAQPLADLVHHLEALEVPRVQIVSTVVSMVVAAAFPEIID